MRLDIDPNHPIWKAWLQGGALVGDLKPHSRLTVQPGWMLRTQDTVLGRPAAKLPIRWFVSRAFDQQMIEIPGVRQLDVEYDVDKDVGTLTAQLTNNVLDPDYGSSEWLNSNGDFGRPGYLTPTRGQSANRWGYVPNEWAGMLTRNALLFSWEGYGGHGKTLQQAVADGNLVLSGIWLVDDAPIKTGQQFTLQATNMAKLLVTQEIFPPLVPAGDYPMQRSRFYYTGVQTPIVVYGHAAVPPTLRILAIATDATTDGYWLVGTDGGVFSYGLAHFWGSIDSIGLTISTGTYPNEGITDCDRSPGGSGYWMVTSSGAVYAFGDAQYHGGLALGPSPAHPIIAICTTGTADGYWLVSDSGGVYTYGGAAFYGAEPALVAGAKIVDAESTLSGNGYWMVDDRGHVYTFGDAAYYGGLSSTPAQPICAICRTPSGNGYYLCAKDGGVFCFGDAQFYGSVPAAAGTVDLLDVNTVTGNEIVSTDSDEFLPIDVGAVVTSAYFAVGTTITAVINAREAQMSTPALFTTSPGALAEVQFQRTGAIVLNDPVSDMGVAVDGSGYWLVAEDGGVFTFRAAGSNVQFFGSLPAATSNYYGGPGNYVDYIDIIKDLVLYAGFNLWDNGQTDSVYGVLESTGIYAPDEVTTSLDPTFFDKLPVIDPIHKIRDVVGMAAYVDDEGAFHFHCVDDETEMLTARGWLRQEDIKESDRCLTLDRETHTTYWEEIDDIHRYAVQDAEMVSMEARGHSSLTTPNHQWWVRQRVGYPHRYEAQWRRSDELTSDSSIPIAAPYDSPVVPEFSDDFAELAGWWITEGSYQWRGGSIYQSRAANPGKVARIEGALRRLYGEPGPLGSGRALPNELLDQVLTLHAGGASQRDIARAVGIDRHTVHRWVTRGRGRWSHWRCADQGHHGMVFFRFDAAVMAELERACPGRAASVTFLTALTQRQLGLFLDACCSGDGHEQHVGSYSYRRFTQNPGGVMESVQLACILAGIAPGKTSDPPTGVSKLPTITKPAKAGRFHLRTSAWVSPHAATNNKNGSARVGAVRYSGIVWCPKLRRNHVWLARRHGTVYFTGNSPNFWQSGNYLPDRTHVNTVPVVDERVQLTDYTVNTPDKDLRSELIISTEDPELGVAGTVTTRYTPATASELRGMIRPAMWVNQAFATADQQLTMAELIALHIYFKSRLGTVHCMANPLIQIDDQVQILERETFETNVHYVRRIKRTHDRKTGRYEADITTNVLSPPGSWAVVKPSGSPSGSVVTNRPSV